MSISFCSFSSGSSGNSYLVTGGDTALLVDAGISGKRILEGLRHAAVSPERVRGVFITHEHQDHIRSLAALTKKLPHIRAYANEGTWAALGDRVRQEQRRTFVTGRRFAVGDIEVKSFPISHDAAEPVGFSFFSGGKQVSIVTDTGHITEEIYREMEEADILVLESNHDIHMLKMCSYPWHIKQRILGKAGHLSNEDAASALCRIAAAGNKRRQILLAHLSRENNFPEMAFQTICNLLQEEEIYLGDRVRIETILKDQISPIYGCL